MARTDQLRAPIERALAAVGAGDAATLGTLTPSAAGYRPGRRSAIVGRAAIAEHFGSVLSEPRKLDIVTIVGYRARRRRALPRNAARRLGEETAGGIRRAAGRSRRSPEELYGDWDSSGPADARAGDFEGVLEGSNTKEATSVRESERNHGNGSRSDWGLSQRWRFRTAGRA
jgi:hypothetical protein